MDLIIIDLLDNSIDGANRINSENHTGLGIDITINESEFKIIDNCGGFSLETAQKYAFRFGRPNEAPNDKNSIGRFGIGMKRSLFKIGKKFSVETQYQTNEHFKIEVDDNAMWRQTGNSIAVPVLKAVFQSIFDTLKTSRVDPLILED